MGLLLVYFNVFMHVAAASTTFCCNSLSFSPLPPISLAISVADKVSNTLSALHVQYCCAFSVDSRACLGILATHWLINSLRNLLLNSCWNCSFCSLHPANNSTEIKKKIPVPSSGIYDIFTYSGKIYIFNIPECYN